MKLFFYSIFVLFISFEASSQSITVTSPNGGESWAIGNTHNITWSSVGITGNVKIEINGNYPSGAWETLYSSTSNDGIQSWTVSGVNGTAKRIRVTSVNNPGISDISNNNFTMTNPTITVTSPNGGESWAIGNTYNITWTSVGVAGNVRIEINGNYPSGAWETLYSSTSNDGIQSWTVSGVNGTAKRIRVTSVNNPGISDISNSNFTMTNPTITVTSPNGGESWAIGTSRNITWTSSGLTGNVKIEINGNYPSGVWETLYSNTSNDGTEAWTVTGVAGTEKRIRITSVNNPSVSDISNGNFTMTGSGITVTAPNGGESWIIGNTYNITWTSVGVAGNVKIEINGNYPSGTWETLYSSISNDGTEAWTVTGVAGTEKRIRITSVTNPGISDISNNNFTMTNPTITVTSPNGGESWAIGNTYNITWSSAGITGNVKIEINGNYPSGVWETLYSNTSNDGAEAWTVTGVAGTEKRIRVTSVNNPSVTDISNGNFTMTGSGITVTAPNGGESWIIGNTYNITWTSVGVAGNVKIEINGNYPSGTWETLYSSISNDGTEAWTVTGVAGTEKRIRITSVTNPGISDISNNNFTMTNPTITVTSPNGGETWIIGNTYNITWTSVGVAGNVKVEINGNYPSGTWETLYSSISNDGTEAWIVTGVAGTEKRIRITSVNNPGITDISNNNFTMTNPTITVTSPNGGESWAIGNAHNITWSSVGITGNVKIEINGNYPSGVWETLYSNTSNDGAEAWTVTGVAGTEKRIRVTSVNNPSVTDISNGNFTMTSSCLPVNIISHPQNKTVSAGTTTTFNTSVNGTGPFLYYWFKNNVQIPNANSSSYSTGIVTPEDNGSIYKCIVVNCNGVYQSISNNAVLTVTGVNCTPVVIIMEPQSKTVPLGSTANFTVSVNGTPPFVLTWFKNNIQIPGANSLSYTTDILTTFDDGNTYKCIIKNCNNTNQIISNNVVLTVSNSNTSLTFFHHIPEIPHFANRYLLYSSITSNSLPKICSDGSASTIIRYINVGYNEMNYLKFKIKENTSGYDGENFGSFGTIQKYTDSIIVRYTHPQVVATDSMKRTITLQIINSNTNQIIKEQLIEIYRTPVLMVHGLWSNDGEFTEMENRLKLKYYPDEILRRANYQITNDASFSENKNVIPLEINYLIQKAINADYSSGKVDIIAHSMGGILARYYIQNKSQFNFKNNINRLVTLNTPHSGSQGANLLLKEGTPYAMIRNLLFHKFKRCVECGAVNDLRINSEEIDLLRIGEGQSNIIPKRAIVSNTLPGLPIGLGWDVAFINGIDLFLNISAFLLYGEGNDLIVPLSSQIGGLESNYYQFFTNINHLNISNHSNSINYIIDLLKKSSNDPDFTLDNFAPPILDAMIFENSLNKKFIEIQDSGIVTITSPQSGTVVSPGQVVNVNITSTGNINKLFFAAENQNNNIYSEIVQSGFGLFPYIVPNNSNGTISIIAMGSAESGYIGIDSIKLNVIISATLDSISVYPKQISIPKNQKINFSLRGFYSDGMMRDIANDPNILSISSDDNIVSLLSPVHFSADSIGFADINISYFGKTTQLNVHVLPVNAFPTGIYGENASIIEEFVLFQNFPNPFNPNTTFKYSIPYESNVKIVIYNILGQQVQKIENNLQNIGSYEILFNGKGLSSGVYFYSIYANSIDGKQNYVKTKKMLLVK